MDPDPNVLQNAKIITCIVPVGLGWDLVELLHRELGLNTANAIRGRGASQRSGTFADEVGVMTVVVDADRADEVFEYIYHKAEVGTKPHRFIYQAPLSLATIFSLPETVEEEHD